MRRELGDGQASELPLERDAFEGAERFGGVLVPGLPRRRWREELEVVHHQEPRVMGPRRLERLVELPPDQGQKRDREIAESERHGADGRSLLLAHRGRAEVVDADLPLECERPLEEPVLIHLP